MKNRGEFAYQIRDWKNDEKDMEVGQGPFSP